MRERILKKLPDKPGAYLFKDKSGKVIYVGKAKSLKKRVRSYFQKSEKTPKTDILVDKIKNIDYILTASELDALILEDQLIKKYQPHYNFAWKDDKTYPFLKLTTNEKWPRLFVVRRKKDDGSLYFGPYLGKTAQEAIRLVKKLFPIRWCRETPMKMRKQSCLHYHIKNCLAPCLGKIDHKYYLSMCKGIASLLGGELVSVLKNLKVEMQKASDGQDFERAGELRDRVSLLERMSASPPPHPLVPPLQSDWRGGGRFLRHQGVRIEAFDISNIQGSDIVGSMVTFVNNKPFKDHYRRFKVRSVKGKPNDVAAIYEIVKRRYAGTLSKQLPLPDLILIDGGKGQVSAAWKALKEAGIFNITLAGLAKKEEMLFDLAKNKWTKLPANSVLRFVRDEAHRFAIAYHRLRRKKRQYR